MEAERKEKKKEKEKKGKKGGKETKNFNVSGNYEQRPKNPPRTLIN